MAELRRVDEDARFGRISGTRDERALARRKGIPRQAADGARPRPKAAKASPADSALARREAALTARRAPDGGGRGPAVAEDAVPEAAGDARRLRRHRVARRTAGRVVAATRTAARVAREPSASAEGEMEQLGDQAAAHAAGTAADGAVTRLRAWGRVRRAIAAKAAPAAASAAKAQVIGVRDLPAKAGTPALPATGARSASVATDGARGTTRRAWFRAARKATAQASGASAAQGASAATGLAGHSAATVAAEAARATVADVARSAIASTGGILAVLAPAAVILIMVASIVMGIGTGAYRHGTGTLTGTEAEVARALRDAGLSDVQVAAVLGNLEAESGMDPTQEAVFDGMFNYPYERAFGLFQFTDAGSGPQRLVVRRMSDFFAWCDGNGMERTSAGAQATYWVQGYRSDWLTGLHASGYYASIAPEYSERDVSLSAWDSTDDVRFATYAFFACNGRGAASVAHLDRRYEAAERAFAALQSGVGTGQEYSAASDDQRAVADACRATGPVRGGYCATWVTNVFAKAAGDGASVAVPYGNACDMYRSYCTSSDRGDLKVGMLVAVPSVVGGTTAGRSYGHVGIYVGDGYVMHSTEGEVRTDSLDDWLGIYDKGGTARWGFPG